VASEADQEVANMLPGWNSLNSVERLADFFQIAGLIALALLVVLDVLAFVYGHRRDTLFEKKIITIESRQHPRDLTGNQRAHIVSKSPERGKSA
jgi:hypothetical protein